jgi:hypothetical protein
MSFAGGEGQLPDLGAQAPLLYANSYWTTSSQKTNNADTDFNTMLSGMAAVLPTKAGTGTASSPQSVLIIITDGLSDNGTDGVTQLTGANITQCTNIKKYTPDRDPLHAISARHDQLHRQQQFQHHRLQQGAQYPGAVAGLRLAEHRWFLSDANGDHRRRLTTALNNFRSPPQTAHLVK